MKWLNGCVKLAPGAFIASVKLLVLLACVSLIIIRVDTWQADVMIVIV